MEKTSATTSPERLYDKKTVCIILGGDSGPISIRKLEGLIRRREIACRRIGHAVRFTPDDILEFLQRVADPAIDKVKANPTFQREDK